MAKKSLALDSPDSSPNDTRITLPIDGAGRLVVDRMHGRSRERVKQWISDPQLARELGAEAPAAPAAADVDMIPLPLIHSLVSTIGQLGMAFAERAYGLTNEQAAVMQFTKDERDAIAPPLSRVINKYAGAAFQKYGDELALVGLLVSTYAAKLETVRQLARKPATVTNIRAVEKPAENPSNDESQEGKS